LKLLESSFKKNYSVLSIYFIVLIPGPCAFIAIFGNLFDLILIGFEAIGEGIN